MDEPQKYIYVLEIYLDSGPVYVATEPMVLTSEELQDVDEQ
jgi:hypothetical protein